MVQIEAINDSRVSGVFAVVAVGDDGRVEARRNPLSGTIEDKALNLSISSGDGIFTGLVVPNGLDLTFMVDGDAVQLLFEKKDAAEFDKIVTGLRDQATTVRHEKAAAEAKAEQAKQRTQIQQRIDAHTETLLADAQTISAKIQEIVNVFGDYKRIAGRAGELRKTAQGVDAESYDGSYRLSDISYRMERNREMAASWHENVQDYWRTTDSQRQAYLQQASQLMLDCQSDAGLSCSRLSSAMASYGQSISALRSAVNRENTAFEAERRKF